MELGFPHGHSVIHHLDPRARIGVALAFAVLCALADRFAVLGACLVLALLLVALARLKPRQLLWQVLVVNIFIVILWLTLPLATPGAVLARIGPVVITREGVLHAVAITLKCNAIVFACTALLATMGVVRVGHALQHLAVPSKLVQIFLFTVRYFDIVHHEYHRMRSAMRVRCFRPRTDRHTYRTYAHLVGMLLVRSFDRSERVLAAMKCRGFRGRFYLLKHFAMRRSDYVFAMIALITLLLLGYGQWAPPIR